MNTASQQQADPPPPWAAYMPSEHTELRLLRIEDVLERTGYSARGWYDAMNAGNAPPGQIRGGTVVWSSHEIEALCRWQAATLPTAPRRRRNG